MGSMKGIPFPYSAERWSTEYRDFGITDATPDWVKEQAKNYYKEGNKQHIKNRMAKVKNWAFDHNVPLICNEWGALSNTAKIGDLNAYFKTMGEIFREMDISWQVWFGIMDSENRLLPGMAEALDLKKR
jgi:endoglucanase